MNKNQSPPQLAELRRTDFGLIGRATEQGAMAFARSLPFEAGARVLDIGCGTGNCAIALARAGCDVTGVDGREPHLSRARAWASNEALKVRFKKAQYERLPFSDNNFHLTLSFMGLLFSRDPKRALCQAQRVTRSNGYLALTAWSLDSFMGELLSATAAHSDDAGFHRALRWCERNQLQALVEHIAQIQSLEERALVLKFPWPPAEVAQCYLRYYTTLARVYETLEKRAAEKLQAAVSLLWHEANESNAVATQVTASYWEIIASVKSG